MKTRTIKVGRWNRTAARAMLSALIGSPAMASSNGGEMPWNTPLDLLMQNLTGPVAHLLIAMAVVISGVTWAFTEHGTGGRKISQLVFGGSVALGAVAFLQNLGFAGALL